MSIQLLIPSQIPLVSLDDLKTHLRVSHDAEDVLIEELARAATSLIETQTGLSLSPQIWRQENTYYQGQEIALLRRPLNEISDVTYKRNTLSTDLISIPQDLYRVIDNNRIMPLRSHAVDGSVFIITYMAGFEEGKLPADLRLSVLQLTAHFYENRDVTLPKNIEALISPYREVFL